LSLAALQASIYSIFSRQNCEASRRPPGQDEMAVVQLDAPARCRNVLAGVINEYHRAA
jgi:hypothetical protein